MTFSNAKYLGCFAESISHTFSCFTSVVMTRTQCFLNCANAFSTGAIFQNGM